MFDGNAVPPDIREQFFPSEHSPRLRGQPPQQGRFYRGQSNRVGTERGLVAILVDGETADGESAFVFRFQ